MRTGGFGPRFPQGRGAAGRTLYVGAPLSYSHLQNRLVANTVAASVLGGTASTLGGGKFANGAVTGAFGYLFNDALHHAMQQGTAGGTGQGNNKSAPNTNPNGLTGSVKTGPNVWQFVFGGAYVGGFVGLVGAVRYFAGLISVEAAEDAPFFILLEGFGDAGVAALAVGAAPIALVGAGVGAVGYGVYKGYLYLDEDSLGPPSRNQIYNSKSSTPTNLQVDAP